MISVCQLTKRFPRGKGELIAVDGISFEVAAGEVYGLMGPNGAGKTTTLRMILGLMPPNDGYAEVAGHRTSAAADAVKARVGFVSTEAGLYQWLTVRELLQFFGDIYGVPPQRTEASIKELAELLEFEEFLDQRCGTLSTGQKQRVVLARSLVHHPDVMLLDEPTRGLDVIGSQVIFDYIDHLRDEGKAVIVCTHRLDEAQRLCDRFGLMYRGRIVHEGTLDQLRAATGCESLVEMFQRILHGSAADRQPNESSSVDTQ